MQTLVMSRDVCALSYRISVSGRVGNGSGSNKTNPFVGFIWALFVLLKFNYLGLKD